ncbi:D-erythronate dehydrogenase [Stappia sp. ES.058]|uniref:D-erythronate dehydrogenase n=1 Tax=Stappia sp. ES.058 TaxID=1881061 RepID=UPI0008795A07|nr:D-erythronate dehydrogenase [Stappia sp. ES.058]SDU37179.1 Nucleoside-diphosphate-sugar epimerase [Stappia sp. ES.058]
MVHVLVTGAAGMLGRKLVETLARGGQLRGREVTRMTLSDMVAPQPPDTLAMPVTSIAGDFSRHGAAETLVAHKPDVIFHLAAVVSGEAEAEMEKGYEINLDGTRRLLDALCAIGGDYCPRVVFASSLAVFGAPLPDPIPDTHHLTPLTSYGTQKAMCELLLADYSRRGLIDGIGIRLPTIVVRPGRPNKAASGFFSGIIREPLNGEEAILPVADDVAHWVASPRAAIGYLMHAASLETDTLGAQRSLTMPGLRITVAQEIETLARIAGPTRTELIRREADPVIARIVAGWPRSFDAARAEALGFQRDPDFETVVRAYMEDAGIGSDSVAAAPTGV